MYDIAYLSLLPYLIELGHPTLCRVASSVFCQTNETITKIPQIHNDVISNNHQIYQLSRLDTIFACEIFWPQPEPIQPQPPPPAQFMCCHSFILYPDTTVPQCSLVYSKIRQCPKMSFKAYIHC